jgi:hypothetical protein
VVGAICLLARGCLDLGMMFIDNLGMQMDKVARREAEHGKGK